jgi:hypothetical protein
MERGDSSHADTVARELGGVKGEVLVCEVLVGT